MKKILVLYPKLFKCYQKFHRKVEKILSASDAVELIYPSDENDFIQRISDESQKVGSTLQSENWSVSDITHAIVFDDGEEFPKEVKLLIENSVPLRFINIAITRVINIKREPEYKGLKSTPEYEYIGRGSYWGNPYSMYEDGEDREEVIRKYKYDFVFEKFPNKDKNEVYKLAGKRLGCFCKPESCHGDVLADFLNSWDDGK
ncbi:DUF4326 domain-containing protein [Chromohalobacter canadensis]|uniref:DUF4326 domain-containing protein n=1 Tax=Chromohalobacter canadensis TaxID=141389 RepID=A0ABZ0YC07_9GAMM|nr:DUF4326 domain-containing protein [Chromohalobacter canadensis]MCK0769984.1 DUF4326 domain-containing protein [Chromohalobacter canadensis]WQH09570.1 DUF4326 domain-containing protein [Chromohalobacter canadensis]